MREFHQVQGVPNRVSRNDNSANGNAGSTTDAAHTATLSRHDAGKARDMIVTDDNAKALTGDA